jgi:hypothetical protein
MIETVGAFAIVVAVLSAAVDIGGKVYDYAEPKVQQGVEYIEEKLD